jgi:nitric oxide synthase oxygenase domain/subunit
MLTIQKFIKQRPHLVWYIKDPGNLNDEAIVEHVLNYGNWGDVQEVIKILGIKTMTEIFNKQINQKRINYDKKILNYFKLYFAAHA